MANLSKKKVWFKVIRKDIDISEAASQSSEPVEPSEAFNYEISEGQTGEKIKQDILGICNLSDLSNVVFKLRNHRGSLVPFTSNLPTSTNTNPYTIEVVKVHQNIKAKPRSIKITCYGETMNEKVADILKRIEKLENNAPELNKRREVKIDNEMKGVEEMLNFLTKRMHDAEQTNWQGMFKKNPLW